MQCCNIINQRNFGKALTDEKVREECAKFFVDHLLACHLKERAGSEISTFKGVTTIRDSVRHPGNTFKALEINISKILEKARNQIDLVTVNPSIGYVPRANKERAKYIDTIKKKLDALA